MPHSSPGEAPLSERHFAKKHLADTLKPKRPRSGVSAEREETLTKELSEIYRGSDGHMPDMHHFVTRPRRSVLAASAFFILACAALVAAVGGVFFWRGGGVDGFAEDDIIMTVSGEETVLPGQPSTFRIRYRNDEKVALTNVILRVRYPEGFRFISSTRAPSSEGNGEWNLGRIEPTDSGYIDVVGTVFGDAGESQSLRVFLTYTPENFQSEFQKVATLALTQGHVPVALTVKGPEEVVSGAPVDLSITVHPETSDLTLTSTTLMVIVTPNGQFEKRTSVPASEKTDPYRWVLGDVRQDATITLSGRFLVSPGSDTAAIKVGLYARQTDVRDAEPVLLKETDYQVRATASTVIPTIVVNGSNSSATVVPGKSLVTSIAVENRSDKALKGVRIRAVFESPMFEGKSIFDWTKLVDERDGTVVGENVSSNVRRGSITWDSKQIPALKELAPGADVMLDLDLPVKYIDQSGDLLYPSGDILARVEVQYDGAGTSEVVSGNRVTVSIVSDTALDVQSKSAPKGTGTVYTINWVLSNTVHPLKDIRMEASVYGDAAWDEAKVTTGAGKATFDSSKKIVTWTIPQMPLTVDVLPLQFTLTLPSRNPTQTQLMSKITGIATDAVSGKEILFSGEQVDL